MLHEIEFVKTSHCSTASEDSDRNYSDMNMIIKRNMFEPRAPIDRKLDEVKFKDALQQLRELPENAATKCGLFQF